MIECESVMFDLLALALQSNSARVLSLVLSGGGQVFTLEGKMLKNGCHALSHHGNDPEKIAELIQIDRENMRCLASFLKKLKSFPDWDGKTLLDNTLVLFGTGMGDASRHSNDDLPTLLAGGGFKHGRHLAFSRNAPEQDQRLLGDLFISMERRLGLESSSFSNWPSGHEESAKKRLLRGTPRAVIPTFCAQRTGAGTVAAAFCATPLRRVPR